MEKILVRVLSTGRSGTKFMSRFFADQGYLSFHEHLYSGEPRMALIAYIQKLGDLWKRSPDEYFQMEDTRFVHPYLRAVQSLFSEAEQKSPIWQFWKQDKKALKGNAIFDAQGLFSAATLLVDKEFTKENINVKYIILYRNPFKTIHAIYQVEKAALFPNRPPSFMEDYDNLIQKAAAVWANYYAMYYGLRNHVGEEKFIMLELDAFTWKPEVMEGVFDFLGLPLDVQRAEVFRESALTAPLRSKKTGTDRNSDLFRDPDFYFNANQQNQVIAIIKETASYYEIDLNKALEEYILFHKEEKKKMAFQ